MRVDFLGEDGPPELACASGPGLSMDKLTFLFHLPVLSCRWGGFEPLLRQDRRPVLP